NYSYTTDGSYTADGDFTTQLGHAGAGLTSLRDAWAKGRGHRLVVIDDEGMGFSARENLWHPFLRRADSAATPRSTGRGGGMDGAASSLKKVDPTYLSSTFVVVKASHWLAPPTSELLKFLQDPVRAIAPRTLLVLSGESLRGGLVSFRDSSGIKLSKTVSWERTLEDFIAALGRPNLNRIDDFGHIVVRLGLEGALIYSRLDADEPAKVRLVFDPGRTEGEYSGTEGGEMSGLTTVFMAAIVRQMSRALSKTPQTGTALSEINDRVLGWTKYALQCARRYYDLGYGPTPDTVRKFEQLQIPATQIFGSQALELCANDGRHDFADYEIADVDEWNVAREKAKAAEGRPSDAGRNSILFQRLTSANGSDATRDVSEDQLLDSTEETNARNRAVNAAKLGRSIVTFGAKEALQRFASASGNGFPYARFRKLLSVDRREIEGLRSVRTLLREYIDSPSRREPISIAVFGPPGSGKSFGVKQIAEDVYEGRIQEFVFNLAQFSDFRDVTQLLLQVRDAGLDEKLPLVFFDEFDSPLANRPLGWLKFFLAPMQDGRFQHGMATLGIGKAIFVFAGGIAATHSEFSDKLFWDKQYEEFGTNVFRAAKGPDFHSRLRGYLNVVGANPDFVMRQSRVPEKTKRAKPSKADPYRDETFTYVLRRALLVRQWIETLSRDGSVRLLDEEGRADVDRDVLDALLLCEEYKHGVRSLLAVLEMCKLHGHRAISKTSLPSRNLLKMHVDRSFNDILTLNTPATGSPVIDSALEILSRESRYQ
nr:ATP-binding protein [Planctomycetota bacterium]